ncbi:DUF6049 family protein [Actinomadura rupiterrae]|uniref:DUF6049 family protein n=1 Tax=Actinomadura rupiterrae TaxID=559627 RepID=UPI0020A51FC1|nr:DUF6049 family protein [Actinomadura rupiterrae]MCP2340546.1 hypothetical protein [Actinomadura rupiterrae]
MSRAAALAALVPCLLTSAAPGAFALPSGGASVSDVSLTTSALAAEPQAPDAEPQAPDASLPQAPDSATQPEKARQGKVTLALSSVSPKAAEATGKRAKVRITGTVTNGTGRDQTGLTVRMRYNGTALTTRSQLERYAEGQPSQLLRGVGQKPAQLPKAAAPNGSQAFSLDADTADIGMRRFGVYPVGVEVVNAAQEVVAGVITFVTFSPKPGDVKPIKVGWVWPLIDRQHRTAGDMFTDDDLNAQFGKGGRLSGLVSAAATTKTPLTWAVDPALLDDARQMATAGYRVQGLRDDKSVKKPKSAAADAWLKSLKPAMKGDPYFALPYADPDVVALVRSKQKNQVALAYRNSQVATAVLGGQPSTPMAWPPSGVAGPGTLKQLVQPGWVGSGPILMSSDNAFGGAQNGYTPNAVTTADIGGRQHAVLTYDDKITDILDQDPRAPGAKALTEQRFLAETAMITAEQPQTANRTLVVAPGRHWSPSADLAQGLLNDTSSVPWLKASTLEQIARTTPQQRQQKDYPEEYQGYELGPGYLEQVHRIQKEANTFASIVVNSPSPVYERAVLRLESVSWRSHSSQAFAARRRVSDELAADTGRVRVVSVSTALAGNSGMVHITVSNDLPDQTVRVTMNISSENSAKLQIGKLEGRSPIELRPNDKVTRNLPVTANGNGRFRLLVQLASANGDDYGDPHVITVRTTGYGRTSLLITGGALAVLFVGVGVRAMRARRRRKAEAAGDGPTGTGPAAGAPGPYYPGAEPLVSGDSGLPKPGPGAGPEAGPSAYPGAPAGPGGADASAGPEAGLSARPAGPGGSAGPAGSAAGPSDGESAGSSAGAAPGGVPAEPSAARYPMGPASDAVPTEYGPSGSGAADPGAAGPGGSGPGGSGSSEPGTSGPAAGRHASGNGAGPAPRAGRDSRATVRDSWSSGRTEPPADGADADAGTSGDAGDAGTDEWAEAGGWFGTRTRHESGNGSEPGSGNGSGNGNGSGPGSGDAGNGTEPGDGSSSGGDGRRR